jgi:hypothetical protein
MRLYKQFPTRLVDVQRGAGGVGLRPCCAIVKICSDAIYVSLNHAWSSKSSLTLTTKNVSQSQHKIPVYRCRNLSKTPFTLIDSKKYQTAIVEDEFIKSDGAGVYTIDLI